MRNSVEAILCRALRLIQSKEPVAYAAIANRLEGLTIYFDFETKKKVLDNLIGGSLMKLMGSPSGGDVIKAFLTGDPTGQWHLTVGNPMNPMMKSGLLVIENFMS